MTNSSKSRSGTGKMFLVGLSALVVAFGALVSRSEAQVVTLTDQNSLSQVDLGTQAGMFNWLVDGTDQLYQQWFWYRVGNTPEQSIDTISAPAFSQPNARTLYTTYANANFSVEADFQLTGSTPGSGASDLGEAIRISNLSGAALDFHFFQYTDFDLAGTPGGDTVQLGKNLFGLFNEAVQTKGNSVLTETVASPGANHGEANIYPNTFNKLNDGLATTLNDNAGPVGPADATWAFQWDLTIYDGQSVLISKDKHIQVIPEPATVGLVLLGLIALGLQKRRPSA